MKKNIWITYSIFLFFILTFFGFYNCSLSKELKENKKETLREKQQTDSLVQVRDSLYIDRIFQLVSYKDTLHPLDSTGVSRLGKEIASVLANRNAMLADSKEYILEKSIDDARQETNNIINKVNGWISFWIAMLAFVGGLIPALIAVKNAEEGEKKLGQYKEDLQLLFDKQVKLIKEECFKDVSAWKVEEKELRQLQRKLTLENEKNKIISVANTLITSVTPSIIKCHANRKELVRIFLIELHKNYSSFIRSLQNNSSTDSIIDYTDEAIMVLIHVEVGLIKARTVYTDCSINREFDMLLRQIRNTIERITTNRLSADELMKELNNVYAYFPALMRVI